MPEPYRLPRHAAMIDFIDAVFHDLNIGLLIYHVPDRADIGSLRLIYANSEASRCTGTDLNKKVGKTLFEAFPALGETEAPAVFSEVVNTRTPRRLGIVEYGDSAVEHANYKAKAFPMPSDCLGVIFENLSRDEGEAPR